ncbi:hypothetical protein [Gelria sp. Kuro-4]|uniref:hypothetical protein n=1 Tax=Gelria sp. Kuro-4 TaxID=2796927 RepID=UPI001C7F37F3|nr:hypothetical protein [Gelria sp. Kuro-4]
MKLVGLIILQGLLEMTGTVGLSLVLARTQFSWKKAFLVGSGLFVVLQIVRHLPLFFGLHTLIGLLISTVYLIRCEKVSVARSFMAAFLSLFFLGLLEFAFNELFLSVLHISGEVVVTNPIRWALIGLPQGIVMILSAWGASRVMKPYSREKDELSRLK